MFCLATNKMPGHQSSTVLITYARQDAFPATVQSRPT